MTKNEFIAVRISELEARQHYAAQMVMNREMAHEAKMCALQIEALLKQRDMVVIESENALPKIGPITQFWQREDGKRSQLIHTDDHGHDTVICEDHLTDTMFACSNCPQPWPIEKG